MARKPRPGPGQLSFSFGPQSTRNTQSTLPRAGTQRRKLQTPYVFTEPTQADYTDWMDVDSSRVMRMRYDRGNHQIQVNFVDGTPWAYEDVPRDVYDAFLASTSKGRFINQVLNGYPYRRPADNETDDW